MYFVVSTLYFTAQNDDRKLGMPTTQASHKNEIWNTMYDIQINYNKTYNLTHVCYMLIVVISNGQHKPITQPFFLSIWQQVVK